MTNAYLIITGVVIVLSIQNASSDFAGLFFLSGGFMLVLFGIGYFKSLGEKKLRKAHGIEPEKESFGNFLGGWIFASLILTLFLFLGSR
jgi:hypothetical protein